MLFQTDDLRIETLKPLIPPAILLEEHPLSDRGSEIIARGREQISAILNGSDDRLFLVVGPCSIHDPVAAFDYAQRLSKVSREYQGDLLIAMRVYFEKPRTTVGWKGLINDPHLDGSFRINEGLRKARAFMLSVTELGLIAGSEFLDPITPQVIADLVAWGAIGARTTESQVHRELASGLSMPVGFKNGTDGTVQIAIDAIGAARHPHQFLSVTKQGGAAIVATRGNPDCHVILRGGTSGPNYEADQVAELTGKLRAVKLNPRLMVDCSHANSDKKPERQSLVAQDLANQIAGGERAIFGLMMESFLVEGRQDVEPDRELTYGQSITDACMSWEQTEPLFAVLAEAVRARRTK
jgi:3-deoxy-7-phosphoheptulonate synthase